MVDPVSDSVILQYIGFRTNGAVREYAFALRGSQGASSEYFVTIDTAAFVEHRVRYQDAPDICSLKLHRELAAWAEHPASTRFSITDAELADYRDAHAPKSKPSPYSRSEDKEF